MGVLRFAVSKAEFDAKLLIALAELRLESQTALSDVANRTVQMAKDAAPVSNLPQDIPDELRDGISAGPVVPNLSGAEVTITSSAPYSVYVELGTSLMSPRPFFRPAMLQAKIEAP